MNRIMGMCAACLSVLALLTTPATAGPVTAHDILGQARELNRTTRRWTDRRQHLVLRIVDRRGGVREREVKLYQKKYEDDRSKAILFFLSPPEVKGTGFLQWLDPHARNMQWLYLPELKRVRQVSGTGQRESFMGTDFSYEDLAINSDIIDWSDTDAEARLEGEDACGDSRCWTLVFVPKEKEVAYGRIRVWMDTDHRLRRLQFCNDKGEVLKELEATDIRQVGAVPTPFHLDMRNLRSGSHTEVTVREITYDSGIDDSVFSERRLEKGL